MKTDMFLLKREKLGMFELLRKAGKPQKKAETDSCQWMLEKLVDPGSFKELYANIETKNPIAFPDYELTIKKQQKKTKRKDAMLTGIGKIQGAKVAIGMLDASFLMGSMGTVVGEKIVRLAEKADKQKLPLLLITASGGARMQEGLFSLMQMAKTTAAIKRFQEHGGLYVSYLTNPTTGGVSASFASLADIMLAEPNALICFAGPRVIEQTIGQTLPEGFQRAEFLQDHGMIDGIVEKETLRTTMIRILTMHGKIKAKK